MENKQLELVVTEKTLGKLITNATDIENAIDLQLKDYSVENYVGDSEKAAKDKAFLNNAKKEFASKRIELKNAFLAPFNEFEVIMKRVESKIDKSSLLLDGIVKAKEEIEKNIKKEEIVLFWKSLNFNLVSLEKIFLQKWLNKTVAIKKIKSEIEEIIKTINNDLETLGSFNEDSDMLKEFYLTNLNLQETIKKGNDIKENRRKLKENEEKIKEEENRRKEQQKKIQEQAKKEYSKEIDKGEKNNFETESEQKTISTPNKNVKKYVFCVSSESKSDLDILNEIVIEAKIEVKKSIKLVADENQIEMLKRHLSRNGLSYSKNTIMTLDIEGI
ncbi:MAG: DUF1351 domain-containing protein [Treponemataceae bacterium]